MSGSDKMEVDDGPPPVVVVDQGQDAKTPGSEEKKKWHLSAPHNSAVSTWPFRGAKSQLLRSPNFCPGGSSLDKIQNGYRLDKTILSGHVLPILYKFKYDVRH